MNRCWINRYIYLLIYVYIIEHFLKIWLHNNLCEFTELEHKFKRWLSTQKTALKINRFLVYEQK